MQRSCEIQLAGQVLGEPIPIAPEIQQRCQDDAQRHYARDGMGQDVFDALLRQVDRSDRGWRD